MSIEDMSRIRYQVACSLDGFIATEEGEYDWIPSDPDIDFSGLLDQVEVLLMGRETYETVLQSEVTFDKEVVVLSSSLRQEDHPDITVISGDVRAKIEDLRDGAAKDIWLFGGGKTFRSLLELNLVDSVEVAVVPVLLGAGIPLLPRRTRRVGLQLRTHQVFPRSGIALLEYDVQAR